jgi:hypothetical protein
VLPNRVVRDPRAGALLISFRLRKDLAREEAITWLHALDQLIRAFAAVEEAELVASIVVGFAPSFFTLDDGSPRFDLEGRRPVGLETLPNVTGRSPLEGFRSVS